jgi:hypothetical protein
LRDNELRIREIYFFTIEMSFSRANEASGAPLPSLPGFFVEVPMNQKSLLTASAVITFLAISSGAEAGECLRGDRTEARLSSGIHRTDRMFRRVGDTFVRVGDRMLGWFHRRPRV